MNMKKILVLVSCMVLIAGLSVGATLAYLTDTDNVVTNTFTSGKVELTLDEGDVYETTTAEYTTANLGTHIEGAARVTENKYHLIPGKQYDKDPIVHVTADSEDSFIFVKVVNSLADIEAAAEYGVAENGEKLTGTIADQIAANGWTQLKDKDGNDVANVFYREHKKAATPTDYTVFTNFKLIGKGLVNGTKPDGYTGTDKFIGDYVTPEAGDTNFIGVTAYAIQQEGFTTAFEAWDAGEFANK